MYGSLNDSSTAQRDPDSPPGSPFPPVANHYVGFAVLAALLLIGGLCLPYLYQYYQSELLLLSEGHHAPPSAAGGASRRFIVVLRHGEKPVDNTTNSLSPLGLARSEWMVRWADTELPEWVDGVRVTAVVTALPWLTGEHVRPLQTVTPLSVALGLPILLADNPGMAASIALSTTAKNNSCALVCWQHEDMQLLLQAMGHTVPEWDDLDFDLVYLLNVSSGNLQARSLRWEHSEEYIKARGPPPGKYWRWISFGGFT
eukprot:RCo042321